MFGDWLARPYDTKFEGLVIVVGGSTDRNFEEVEHQRMMHTKWDRTMELLTMTWLYHVSKSFWAKFVKFWNFLSKKISSQLSGISSEFQDVELEISPEFHDRQIEVI
jgi:hypothetical protein